MPYPASEPNPLTRKANTPRRRRQWNAVYESSKGRGDDEGTAIAKASGVVKKDFVKHHKAASLSPLDLAGRSHKRLSLAEKMTRGAGSALRSGDMGRGSRMQEIGMKLTRRSLNDLDRSGFAKRAFMGAAIQTGRGLLSKLPGALKASGVGRRVAIGAGAGAVAGAAMAPEGKGMSRAIGGAALGAGAGALSSKVFRGAMKMPKGPVPSPAGTHLFPGAKKSIDLAPGTFKVGCAVGYAKQAERTLFEHPSEQRQEKGLKAERGDRPSSSIKDDGDSPLQPRTSKQTMDAA